MDLATVIAHWSGTVPPGVLTEAGQARCAQPRCTRPVALKKNGQPAKSCLCVAPHKQLYVQ